ncbi:FtsX-like permease family protein [Eubacterium sp.]|uniref:FtsX-like permease family protein n=1 Tax=Eubacterium sp. TaxID=142586 RepID=UPI0025DC7542|nr:FtsX-like permease family protein [Eubacterium sp.]MCR5629176.1 hypothetical protein [Eubacterium sp.]
MNFLIILMNDLKRLIKYNKVTFIVVSVSMMFVTYGVLFYAGYIAYGYEKEQSEIYFDVYLNDGITKEKTAKLCESLRSDSIIQMVVADSKDNYESDDNSTIVGEYNKSYDILRIVGKPYGLNDTGKGIVVDEILVEDKSCNGKTVIGEKIKINDEEFPIKAVVSFKDYLTISTSIKYYINNFKTHYIKLGYNNKKIKKHIIKILEQDKDVKKYDIEESSAVIFNLSFWGRFAEILLMFCVIIINTFMIISYWIKQQQSVYNIYKICGASERMVHFLEICKMFCILSISSIFSLIIFFVMKKWMVSKGLVANMNLFYVEICMVVLIILLLFTCVAVNKEHKKSTIYHVKE